MMKITTLLLDIDGTLVDSNDAHTRAWLQALTEFGFKTNYATVREKIGMGGDKLLPSLSGLSAQELIGKKIVSRRAEIFKTLFLSQLKAFPETRELLKAFLALGLQLVVATSASKDDLLSILKQAHLQDLLKNLVTSDDAENSKPDPDILKAALTKVNAHPDQAVMIGDTPYDLKAAQKANVRSVGFTCGGWSREALYQATEIYAGPADLLEKLSHSLILKESEYDKT